VQVRVRPRVGTASSPIPKPAISAAVAAAGAPPRTVTARVGHPRCASATATLTTFPLAQCQVSSARFTSPAASAAKRMMICQAGERPAATTGPAGSGRAGMGRRGW